MGSFEDIKRREKDLRLVNIATNVIAFMTGFILGLLAVHFCN